MATFRSGFKILGELPFRQSLGRIRSISEDRKPGSWLPEDQWAVRPPCTTCPDPCAPKKPPKTSKSWLSICSDPEPPIPCDIRHNNCPPPKKKDEEPWYSFITKKKIEKPKPPLNACRKELLRQAENPAEDYCEDIEDYTWPECYDHVEPQEEVCPERSPAPVIRLSCPPPKDLDLMLWCGKPGLSVARIASLCQSDRMPYDEFRPKKSWKPPPFSLPTKNESPPYQPFCCNVGRAPLSEYKQVEIPKPLYTRYKSVELEDENFLLCMTDAKCPNMDRAPSLTLQPPPIQKPELPPEKPKPNPDLEKPVLIAASQKPVKLRCAPKFKFIPKPTKLVERRQHRNPCAQHNICNLTSLESPCEEKSSSSVHSNIYGDEPAKVITGTLTSEPQMYERNVVSEKPPHWMYMLSKPGSKVTPLVPHVNPYPEEPDWCGETDGLKFYDGQDDLIYPKPPPDPCRRVANEPEPEPPMPPPCPHPASPTNQAEEVPVNREKFVLMPDKYNIRNMRPPMNEKNLEEATFQEFIDAKTANVRSCSKYYSQMKENILYDLARNCPLPPFDPSKADPPPRRPPQPECPQPLRFYYRRYSTLSSFFLRKPDYAKFLNRMMSEDSDDKCKPKKLIPKPKDCDDSAKGPTCNETELPCCPKARIPPRCDVKKKLPPCKKKLAPKPSYSECSKDPTPCPRITECNAWEKREFENHKKSPGKCRKFSNWAPERERLYDKRLKTEEVNWMFIAEGATAPGPSYSEYLDLIHRGKSLNKNKWSHIPRKVFSGKQLMLNFVNPTEDTNSYYKSDSLVRRRKPEWRKLKTAPSESKQTQQSVGNHMHEREVISALLQDHHTRGDARNQTLRVDDKESALVPFAEENSFKPFMGPIGEWINALVKAKKKRSNSCPPPSETNDFPATTYVHTVDVDRIMKLTKPLRHKSRSLENVSCNSMELPAENVDCRKTPSPFRRLWGRNRSLSVLVYPRTKDKAQSSFWKYEILSPTVEYNSHYKSDTGKSRTTRTVKNNGDQPQKSSGNVLKEKRETLPGLDFRKIGEYSIPNIEGVTGKALILNKNFNDSPGVVQGVTKEAYRWYTTTHTPSHYMKGINQVLKQSAMKKKSLPKFPIAVRRTSTCSKIRPAVCFQRSMRTGMNSSTEFVVAKKVGSVPSTKKKTVLDKGASKTKFMQSATSSLVMAKMLSENGMTSPEKAVTPLTNPQKPWIYIDRGSDNIMKREFKKTISHATIIKTKPKKWFQDVEEYQNDPRAYVSENRKEKKSVDIVFRKEVKSCSDKYLKRQEVRNMLSEMEPKGNVIRVRTSAVRQKDGYTQNVMEDQCCANSSEKDREGRFGWQHALFRKPRNKTVIYLTPDSEPIKSLTDLRESIAGPKALKISKSEGELPKKLNNEIELYETDLDVFGEKPSIESVKKCIRGETKSKVHKDFRPRDQDRLIKSFTYEMSELLESKEGKGITTAMSRPGKVMLSALQTRRYTNNSRGSQDKDPRDGKCRCNTEKCRDSDKKNKMKEDCKCRKKEKKKDGRQSDEEFGCRWDSVTKPGPKCPDD